MAKIPATDCPAGPALDAAVAKVLEHEVIYRHDLKEWFIASDGMAFQEGMRSGMFFETSGGFGPIEKRYCLEMPRYSSRIAAAWELWQHVKESNWAAFYDYLEELCTHHYNGTPVESDYCGVSEYDVMASLSPLTITRAFLLAHGVTEVEVADD